ncbi:MAG: hypothetical protein ACLPR9_03780 [Acidimicrobiales bacterium]
MDLDQPGPAGAGPDGATRTGPRRRGRDRSGATAMPLLVGAGTLALRLATAASGPTDWDSAQYASAVDHFDVTHGKPQPPGYWLYVESGRLVGHLTGLGAVHSLVVVAALASALGAGLTAVAGRDLGGWWVGLAAGCVVAASPFTWFSGSIVATYSFDMVACSLLVILAWRARPGSWHGVAAVGALGLLVGFRQSIIQSFAILALIAVVGSTRRWGQLVVTALAGLVTVGIWFVPMALEQPGGASAWLRATRIEASGAAQSTSVLDHAAGGATNLGTFAAFTVVALAPLAALTALAGIALLIRRLARWASGTTDRAPAADGLPTTDGSGPVSVAWVRPWYQRRWVILGAAIVPPMALVALVQFAKGGYLLAYFPAAVIALLLPVAALFGPSDRHPLPARVWLALASVGVALVVALGAQRFLEGDGVLPQSLLRSSGTVWLEQPRYQAPYADTRATIRTSDAIDDALRALGPSIRPARDVVVFDTLDGGSNIYRNAGWELPEDRIALVGPGRLLYNELHDALYYASGKTTAVGRSGSAFLVASPALPGLASLTALGYALPVTTPQLIGGYRVWQILPGVAILGVRVVEAGGPRPLGTGL